MGNQSRWRGTSPAAFVKSQRWSSARAATFIPPLLAWPLGLILRDSLLSFLRITDPLQDWSVELRFGAKWTFGNIWKLHCVSFLIVWNDEMSVTVWGIVQCPWPLVWSPVRHWITATFAAIRVVSGRERWRPPDHTSARKPPCTTAVLFHESLLQWSNFWVLSPLRVLCGLFSLDLGKDFWSCKHWNFTGILFGYSNWPRANCDAASCQVQIAAFLQPFCPLRIGLPLLAPSLLQSVPKAAVFGTLIFVGTPGICFSTLWELLESSFYFGHLWSLFLSFFEYIIKLCLL